MKKKKKKIVAIFLENIVDYLNFDHEDTQFVYSLLVHSTNFGKTFLARGLRDLSGFLFLRRFI